MGLTEEEPCTTQSTMLSGTELMLAPATECQTSRIRQVALDVTRVLCSRNYTEERDHGLLEQV